MDEQSTSSKKSKKSVIMLIVLVLILVGGAAAYFVNKNNNDEQAQQAAQAAQAAKTKETANTLSAASTSGMPFVATVSTTTSGGQKVNGVMSSDGDGNVSYAYKADGKDVSLIYTADAYYLCNGTDTCIKYPSSSTSGSGFDPSAYQYDSNRIASLKDTAAYKGQQTCPGGGGTCDVWSVSSAGATTTMYVNASTKKIAKVTTATATSSSDITYEYKNVTVAAPANSVTLPTGQ